MARDQTNDTKEVMLLETDVKEQIYYIRGHNVILDSDLATLYNAPTKALNQAVRRNIERLPNMEYLCYQAY